MPLAITVTGTPFHAGVTLNAADVVDEHGIFKESFCYEFGSERSPGISTVFAIYLFFADMCGVGIGILFPPPDNIFGFAQIISDRGLVSFAAARR